LINIDPPAPGDIKLPRQQPFSANATDKLGLSISLGSSPLKVSLTFLSWGKDKVNMSMEPIGNLLFGIGPPLGIATNEAVYVIAFTGIYKPLVIK
jgi:hypothetical protein